MKIIIETPTASGNAKITPEACKVLRDHSGLPDRLRGWNAHIIGDEGRVIFHGTRNELCIIADLLQTMVARIDREVKA